MKSIKKTYLPHFLLIFLLGLMLMLSGCSFFRSRNSDRGEFKSNVRKSPWIMEAPDNMVLVPTGSFMMGEVDQDIFNIKNPNRRVTVSSFFMDDTEITNARYRKFLEIILSRINNGSPAGDDPNDPDQNKKPGPQLPTEDFVRSKLYPDSNVWRNDFDHPMQDFLVDDYNTSPAFDDYPVVGISWEAAKYFAIWRTQYLNEYREEEGLSPYPKFSLPSAAQWEYAARGGKELAKYPWGGPSIRDAEGKLRANFKSEKGNYTKEGGYSHTSPVTAFPPNDYGLYDMAGNVSEWTLDAYNPAAVARTSDLDPLYLDDTQPMKIIKGGSWKDISRFLQTGSIDYEHKDSTRSYIGFRCVIPYIGVR